MSRMTDNLRDWIQSFESGAKWINKINSPKTLRNYLPNLNKYCNFVKKNPDELIQLKITGLQNIATNKEFIAEDTLENFLTNSKYPLSVKGSIRATVISFYKANRRNLNEIRILMKSKKGEWKLLGSKKKEIVERKFREALDSTKNVIESEIWYGKGFAIIEKCGLKVDKEFHDLMGLLIMKFNDINIRLDSEKLDEKLVENLQSQFKILTDYAQPFWNISGVSSHPDKEADTMKIIEDFRGRLWDFTRIMEPYLKSEGTKKN